MRGEELARLRVVSVWGAVEGFPGLSVARADYRNSVVPFHLLVP